MMIITRLFLRAHVLGSHSFPYQSLLLNTTVLNDILLKVKTNLTCKKGWHKIMILCDPLSPDENN